MGRSGNYFARAVAVSWNSAMLLPDGLFKAFMIVGAAYLFQGSLGIYYIFGFYSLMWMMRRDD